MSTASKVSTAQSWPSLLLTKLLSVMRRHSFQSAKLLRSVSIRWPAASEMAAVLAMVLSAIICGRKLMTGSRSVAAIATRFPESSALSTPRRMAWRNLLGAKTRQTGRRSERPCPSRMGDGRSRYWMAMWSLLPMRRRVSAPGRSVFAKATFGLAFMAAHAAFAGSPSDLPPLAVTYLPILAAEARRLWPEGDLPTLAAQTEQETCPSLRHSRCWSPRAELRTSRERGVGLGQITRTAKADNLRAMLLRHPRDLAGWSWDSQTLYDPALQARALVLMNRDNQPVADGAATAADWWAMVLVAYNGGPGRVRSDRRLCAGTPGCDPSRWFGHVERTSLLQRTAVHGYGKSFFEINREYPRRILLERRDRYVGAPS